MKSLLIIFGTRPEALKLIPLILELQKHKKFKLIICNTEQQKELSNEALNSFHIKADINLNTMQQNQSLSSLQAKLSLALNELFLSHKIDACIVQGDTMSAFCGALISFYHQIPIFHIEAGLRSYDKAQPFPEEALRMMISNLATLHFAPTQKALKALYKENIKENAFITGNTALDSLRLMSEKLPNSIYIDTLAHEGGGIVD